MQLFRKLVLKQLAARGSTTVIWKLLEYIRQYVQSEMGGAAD